MSEQPSFKSNAIPFKISAVDGGAGGGGVTAVTATLPLYSSGGPTPDISLTDVVPIELGGTNSGTALNNNRVMVSSGGAIIESNDGTDTQVMLGTNPPSFGDLPSGAIPNTPVAAGSYPTAGQISTFTVGQDGRLTAAGSTTSGAALTGIPAGTALSGQVPVANGGTNSGAALNNNRVMVSSGGAIIESNDGTDTQVMLGTNPPSFGDLPSGAIPNTAVAAGSYPTAGQISTFTVGQDGRLTAAGSTTSGAALTGIPAGTALSGQVPVANGGTGAATLTTNGLLYGNGTSPVGAAAAGTAGQVMTSNGAGSPPSMQAPITNTTSSVTGTSTAIAVDDTWTDIGLSRSLPSAGKYMIIAEILCQLSVGAGSGVMLSRFYNDTDSAEVADSERQCIWSEVPTIAASSTTMVEIVTVNAAKTIKAQVMRLGLATYLGADVISTTGFGLTRMRYIKLSD